LPSFVYRGSRPKTRTLGYDFDLNLPTEIPEDDAFAIGKLRLNEFFEEVEGDSSSPAPVPPPLPVVTAVDDDKDDAPAIDHELEALRTRARALNIARVGNKSAETLRAEIAAHDVG
jgi:hypothetical protein